MGSRTLTEALAAHDMWPRTTWPAQVEVIRAGEVLFVGTVTEVWEWLRAMEDDDGR